MVFPRSCPPGVPSRSHGSLGRDEWRGGRHLGPLAALAPLAPLGTLCCLALGAPPPGVVALRPARLALGALAAAVRARLGAPTVRVVGPQLARLWGGAIFVRRARLRLQEARRACLAVGERVLGVDGNERPEDEEGGELQ